MTRCGVKAAGGKTKGDDAAHNGWDGKSITKPINRAGAIIEGRKSQDDWQPPTIDLSPIQSEPPSWMNSLPGMITGAIKSGFAGVQLKPNITVNGSASAPARAPAPRTENGGTHNGELARLLTVDLWATAEHPCV